jgi:hypothetical protein
MVFATAFLLSSRMDPLLFVVLTDFSFKFSPKTACQAQKPPNSIKPKEIEVEI